MGEQEQEEQQEEQEQEQEQEQKQEQERGVHATCESCTPPRWQKEKTIVEPGPLSCSIVRSSSCEGAGQGS